ncbi:MAG: gamma-glutamyl-gamma-aminobutyrate hydrolase family protein, partial [Candidatus Kapaibacteriota bacterium]
ALDYEFDELYDLCKDAHGLVLTGGPDVNPKYYGREEDSTLCEIDNKRDSYEFRLLEYAFQFKIPIFAICRGAQILNIYLGGTLYPDIPTYFPSNITHKCNSPNNQCFHKIILNKATVLYDVLKEDTILVNSFHHQGVEKLADGLKISSTSLDGLIESYEWENPLREPFFIAVQWHPERLFPENTSSKILGLMFLEKVAEYKKSKFTKNK